MIDVRNHYKPLNLPATPYGQGRIPESADAQWEGISLCSDGRVDDCFRTNPLCTDRSSQWVDLIDPRVQNFMSRMAEIKSSVQPSTSPLSWPEQNERSQALQSQVNQALEEAGLDGSSSSCGDKQGALSTAYISIGGMDTAQHLNIVPQDEGFAMELKSIGYGGWHTIEARTDPQGRIVMDSIQESAEWDVPWLHPGILRNQDPRVIATPHDPRMNQLIGALESQQPLEQLQNGRVTEFQGSVQRWDVAGQEVTVDYSRGTLRLHNEGWVDPPAGSDYTGYHSKTDIQWQDGRWGYLR